MNDIFRIGLTGGIGSGKTTVADIFRSLGVPVIDADEIAREVVRPGTRAYTRIIDLFGDQVIIEDGGLRRDRIREAIFSNSELKQRLEEIVHPEVRNIIEQAVCACRYPYCIISIPLLLETGSDYRCDRILVIDTPEEEQLRRTLRRDAVSEQQVQAIMASQATRRQRLAAADDIIDNSGDVEDLEKQVNNLHHKYLGLAGRAAIDIQTPG